MQRTIVVEEQQLVAEETVETTGFDAFGPVENVETAAIESAPPVAHREREPYLDSMPERMNALGLFVRAAIIGLLALRFLLLASGANTSSAFASFVEHLSWPLAAPFANIFPNVSVGDGVIELSTLVAIVVYFLLFKLMRRLYVAFGPRWGWRAPAVVVADGEPEAVVLTDDATDVATAHAVQAKRSRLRRPRFASVQGATSRPRRLFRLVRAPKP